MEKKAEYRKIFSERLALLIKKNNLTSADLAKKLNVSPALITKYTSGKASPSYENFIKIAEVFKVPTDYFLGRDLLLDDKSDNEIIDNMINVLESINIDEIEEEKIYKFLKRTINKLDQNYFCKIQLVIKPKEFNDKNNDKK